MFLALHFALYSVVFPAAFIMCRSLLIPDAMTPITSAALDICVHCIPCYGLYFHIDHEQCGTVLAQTVMSLYLIRQAVCLPEALISTPGFMYWPFCSIGRYVS